MASRAVASAKNGDHALWAKTMRDISRRLFCSIWESRTQEIAFHGKNLDTRRT